MFCTAKEGTEPFSVLLLTLHFPVEWSTHAVLGLFADL